VTDFDESRTAVDENTLKGRYLTFRIENEIYGLEIRNVTEIIGIQAITEMPEMPDYIKGIINLRGKIIPVMDVRLRFSMKQREYDDRTCVAVVEVSGLSVGLIVDSVSEVLTLADESIVGLPQSKLGLSNRYIKNIGKVGGDVVLLLDCEKLLSNAELTSIGASL
jgi:purine-binding chemotaxis protein CheW